VALVCIVASALLSNYLSHREIGQFVQEHQQQLQPVNPNPGQQPPPPPPGPRNINLSFILAGVLGLVLALVLSLVLAGRISRPLSGLTGATRKITSGDYSERVSVGGAKEVEELGEAFNTLAESLDRNEELRKNMVADIAHELRNPLATLRGQLELLQDGKIDCDREAVDSLMEDAVMLSRLVEDLRQLSLVEAGKLDLDFGPVDIDELLGEVASRMRHETSQKGITLSIEAAEGVPAVRADHVRTAQVLRNLVSNSVVHTPAGGSVRLAAEKSGGKVIISVTDNGAGIDGEELPFIFERFYRTDKSRSRSTGGAGLGLSIARSLVEAQGGRIWIESEVGKGTTIHFSLPVDQGPAGAGTQT
jgi:signal transduction histidine kinase